MRIVDIHGATNLEIVRGGTNEWYWATDYIHGDLYEAEELFLQGHPVRSNRLYLIHYPDGMVYEPVHPVDGQYLGIIKALKEEADAEKERVDYLQSLNILLQQAIKDLSKDLGVA